MVGVRDQYFISIRAEGMRANKNRLCSKAGLPLEVVFCISYRYVVGSTTIDITYNIDD